MDGLQTVAVESGLGYGLENHDAGWRFFLPRLAAAVEGA